MQQALPNAAVVLADRYVLASVLGNDRPPLDSEIKDVLLDFYADDIEKTEALIGRDLTSWKRS